MKEHTLYKLLVAGLAILNIGIIVFFLMNKPPHPPQRGQQDFKHNVIRILQLDAAQKKEFHQLAMKHRETLQNLSEEQRELLVPYFQSLIDSLDLPNEEALLMQVQTIERQKIVSTHQHLIDVRSILKKEQLPYFEKFVKEFSKKVVMHKKKSPHHPKEFR